MTEVLNRRLQSRFPKLQVVGCRDGFFAHADDEQIVREINTASPVLLFAGMGSPRQEKWLIHHRPQLNAQILIAAGGSFPHLADLIPRAPRWINANGLEWLYRMLREPARLSSRYIAGSLQFGWHILKIYRKQFRS